MSGKLSCVGRAFHRDERSALMQNKVNEGYFTQKGKKWGKRQNPGVGKWWLIIHQVLCRSGSESEKKIERGENNSLRLKQKVEKTWTCEFSSPEFKLIKLKLS